MFGKTFVAASILAISMAGTAMAQSPTKLNQFDYWGAYSYKAGSGTVCYALSAPTGQAPSTVSHGDNFFLVTKRPGGGTAFEPQFMAGYALREGSQVTVSIDNGKAFNLFVKGSSAWVETPQGEAGLVTAMRAGNAMTVKAVSLRGTNTSYTYSLKGISAALNAVQQCK